MCHGHGWEWLREMAEVSWWAETELNWNSEALEHVQERQGEDKELHCCDVGSL